MLVTVNGEKKEIKDGSTILELIETLRLTPARVAVEVNREIVTRAKHGEHRLNAEDQIEIVHFVGGG
jgi:thiamine biosynthesis protein ThiS